MFPATLYDPDQCALLRKRLMRDMPAVLGAQREPTAGPGRSFDTSILAAPVRPRMPNQNRAGRIRRWISAGAVVALVAVAAHLIVADPLGRLRWDIAWAGRVGTDQAEDGR